MSYQNLYIIFQCLFIIFKNAIYFYLFVDILLIISIALLKIGSSNKIEMFKSETEQSNSDNEMKSEVRTDCLESSKWFKLIFLC